MSLFNALSYININGNHYYYLRPQQYYGQQWIKR